MRAIVYERYGPPEVLQLKEIKQPTPRDHEVLINIYATTVTNGDTRMRSFNVPRGQRLAARLYLGLWKPKRSILGMEIAGVIVAIGMRVTQFQVGDHVLASTFAVGFGGYAEYICLPESGIIAKKPTTLSWQQAAALPGAGMTALRCLRRAAIQPSQEVLIYGASGAVGTNAIQLAKLAGANVTGVCSTHNLELVQALGANQILDYTKHSIFDAGRHYDVVFDAVGKLTKPQLNQLVKSGGVSLNVHTASHGKESLDDLHCLKAYIEQGLMTVSIDRTYLIEQIVEAHRYVDLGHKRGHVAIDLTGEGR